METTVEGDDRVTAAVEKVIESVRASQDSTDDEKIVGLYSRITHAEKIVVSHLEPNIPLFDNTDDSCDFLHAIDELIDLIPGLYAEEPAPVEWIERAESAVQSAMSKLMDELRRVVTNTVRLDADKLYGCINNETETMSFGSDDDDVKIVRKRGGNLADDVRIDVVNEDAVSTIRDIVDRMVRAKFEEECCQVYSSCRREGLEECLGVLGIERLSIEEVQRIEWTELDDKMKRWMQVLEIVVRLVLTREKRLCESIFDGVHCDVIREVCFVETAKTCIMQLLNFGEAVAIGKRSPEKLFRILDMYKGLRDMLWYLRGLFSDESREFVIAKAIEVLDALGEAAKCTFSEFEVVVKGEASKRPVQGGEIHPMSSYVMNYVKLLVEYSETLNRLLEDDVKEGGDSKEPSMSALGKRLTSLIGSLESNIEEKAKLYEDKALQYVFLMNNKLYVVQKVENSELGKLLVDDFVKTRRGVIHKYKIGYLRTSWSKVFSCLRDQGDWARSGSGNSSNMALKEKFKNFNASFEELYRAQTLWKVPDSQLRTELRVSISERVIPAYRSFLVRFGPRIESSKHAGMYIKYTAEDLDGYLADLFEGTPRILNHVRHKGS